MRMAAAKGLPRADDAATLRAQGPVARDRGPLASNLLSRGAAQSIEERGSAHRLVNAVIRIYDSCIVLILARRGPRAWES